MFRARRGSHQRRHQPRPDRPGPLMGRAKNPTKPAGARGFSSRQTRPSGPPSSLSCTMPTSKKRPANSGGNTVRPSGRAMSGSCPPRARGRPGGPFGGGDQPPIPRPGARASRCRARGCRWWSHLQRRRGPGPVDHPGVAGLGPTAVRPTKMTRNRRKTWQVRLGLDAVVRSDIDEHYRNEFHSTKARAGVVGPQ
jgi:hypothetical protein